MSVSSQIALANSKVGKTFGNLLVLNRVGTDHNRRAIFLCRCICGKEVEKTSMAFKSSIASCGCIANHNRAKTNLSHGQSTRAKTTKAYRTWQSIRARCNNSNNKSYKYYGGKGVKVSHVWNTFEAFYRDMGTPPSDKHEIDRINPKGNYEPSNCRWISKQENIIRVIHKRNEKGVFIK